MILFNMISIGFLWVSGEVKAELGSVSACTLALIIMNAVVWRSGKEYPDWK